MFVDDRDALGRKGETKITRYPGQDYGQGAKTFFERKKGGYEFFWGEKKGAMTFFERKKRGRGLFLKDKKGGAKFFSH